LTSFAGYFLIADKIFALTLTVGLLIGLIFVLNQEDTGFATLHKKSKK
jgi:hypothetical protein